MSNNPARNVRPYLHQTYEICISIIHFLSKENKNNPVLEESSYKNTRFNDSVREINYLSNYMCIAIVLYVYKIWKYVQPIKNKSTYSQFIIICKSYIQTHESSPNRVDFTHIQWNILKVHLHFSKNGRVSINECILHVHTVHVLFIFE